MATTKIFPISVDEVASLKYIANPDKTDNGRLIITDGCSSDPLQASHDFEEIRANGTGKSSVLCQHFIVSFMPGEITPERALQVGQEICEKFLKGEYQYFLACHQDKAHIHLHCIFNNTNSFDGRTFETHENRRTTKQDRSFRKLMTITDEVCKKHLLSVIEHSETSKGKNYYEWDMNRQGLSWKAKLKHAIDRVVMESDNFEGFLSKCAAQGILVEYNPDHKIDLKFMLVEQKENNPRAKFTRGKTLGWYYETEQIKKRIAQYKRVMNYTPRTKIRRVTPEAEENKFIRDSIDRNNMKLTSKAINILSKYGVSVEEAKNEAVAAFGERAVLVGELNEIQKEIREREEQLSWLTHYLDTKPFYDKYMSLKGRKQQKYGDKFYEELFRFHARESDLKKVFPKKFPTVEQLKKHIETLRHELETKNAKYITADQKSGELSEAYREIEQYLHQEQQRNQQKKKHRNDLE